ncbi:MAG: AtpZ/AtpI family protein [Gemmatimonadaceae bacterium]
MRDESSGERPEPSRERPAGASGPSAAKYAGIGFQLAISIVLFLYAGQWLDRRLGSEPLFLIVGVFLGATAGFYSIYRKLMGDLRKEEKSREQGGDGGVRGSGSEGA